jgi:hypothetical protein
MKKLSAATLLVLLVLAAPAAAKTETASLGDVRAELSYTPHKDKPPTAIELKVFEGGSQIVDRKISDDMFFQPVGYHTSTKSVRVRDLDGDGSGDAIFDLFTGGAHCCALTYLYKNGTEIIKNWGNPGYRIRGGDLITGDDRFTYHWGSYAASLQPLQVFQLTSDAKLTDVTGERPAMLRKELKRFKRYYRQAVRDLKKDPVFVELVQSSVGAIAADQCSLGHCSRGYDLAKHAIERGYLKPAYLRHLGRFLQRLGYDD